MGILSQLFGSQSAKTEVVDVAEAHRRQKAGAVLIDVREPDEWRAGHAPRATLVPLGKLPARLAELPRDREILLICRSGNRSGQAQRWLRQQGFGNTFNVVGGMNDWQRADLPVER